MFARLKKKIENEDGARISSPRRSESVTSLTGIGLTPPSLHGRDASSPPASITSEDPSMRDVSSARDDYSALLQKKSEQCKKLEGNISDLAALIKDKSKTIEKLETSIKQQDEVTSKKLQEQKEEFEAYRDKLIEGYQTDKIKLDQEKKDIRKELAAAEAYQAKYFRQEEETDEMQGLATQELSKVKHLLLNTEADLSKCQSQLESKTRQCQTAETQVEKLTDELGPLKQQFTSIETDSHRLKEENSERAELITKLSKEKAAFDKRLDELNKELFEKQSQCGGLQVRLADMEETHKTYIRNSDIQKNKNVKSLREKDDLIDTLNERVATLEQRAADSNLSGDDKATALEAERKQMELKLTEARQQLTEIKSTWSDKITHLEQQISHLNTKIAEDGEEISNHQKMTDQMRDSFEKQIDDLKKQLEDAERRALENFELASSKDLLYEKQIVEKESQVEFEMQQAKGAERRSKDETEKLQRQVIELMSTSTKKETDSRERITHLEKQEILMMAQLKESELKIKEIEINLSQREEQVSSFKKKIEEKDTSAFNQDSAISSLHDEVKDLGEKLEKAVKDRNDFEQHLRTSENDKGGLLEKNADLYRQMETLKTSESECRQEHQRTLTLKSEGDANVQKTEATLRNKIQALESQIEQSEISKAESGLYSGRIDEMSDTISTLENQLSDKTRMVKKQEQMLKDLRQTLQRELKVQAIPGDDSNHGGGGGDSNFNAASSSSSSPSSNRRMLDNHHNHHHHSSATSTSSSSLQSSASSPSFNSLSFSSNRLPPQSSSSSSPSTFSSSSSSHYHQYPSNSSSNSHSSGPPYSSHHNHNQPPSPAVLPLDSATSASFHHMLTASSSSVPSGAGVDSLTAHTNYIKRDLEKDVNFLYLKHVVLKFMLSREAEALQLIKAVSMLLNFSNQEQQLMRETLEWKMSWFGARPPQGRGQTSKKW